MRPRKPHSPHTHTHLHPSHRESLQQADRLATTHTPTAVPTKPTGYYAMTCRLPPPQSPPRPLPIQPLLNLKPPTPTPGTPQHKTRRARLPRRPADPIRPPPHSPAAAQEQASEQQQQQRTGIVVRNQWTQSGASMRAWQPGCGGTAIVFPRLVLTTPSPYHHHHSLLCPTASGLLDSGIRK